MKPHAWIAVLMLSSTAMPVMAGNDADLIKGVRTNALFGALPKEVAGFSIGESRSDPNRHTIRARYEHEDGQAAAAVNIRAVRAQGKVVELPDGPESVSVGVKGIIKHHDKQKGSNAEGIELDEANGGPMNCVKVTRDDKAMVRLVCRTAVHGRMIESQSDSRVDNGNETEALALLETFTQEMFSAVRQIDRRDR